MTAAVFARFLNRARAPAVRENLELKWRIYTVMHNHAPYMDEVGQLLTSQIPSCSTAIVDESGFMR